MADLTEASAESANAQQSESAQRPAVDGRVLVWAALIAVSAAAAFVVARSLMGRREPDPTSTRIQSLIDEANQLLRSLDEQKRD
ncbi:hypothetical protein EPN42_15155 [bacterium]|nr:MAG: hypothetical protein EPN42_15155 [bacterium]